MWHRFIYPYRKRKSAIAFFDRAGRALRGDFEKKKGNIDPFLSQNQQNNKIFLLNGKIDFFSLFARRKEAKERAAYHTGTQLPGPLFL